MSMTTVVLLGSSLVVRTYFLQKIVWPQLHQERRYNHDSTASRLLSEVKHDLARSRWNPWCCSFVFLSVHLVVDCSSFIHTFILRNQRLPSKADSFWRLYPTLSLGDGNIRENTLGKMLVR